MENVIIEPVVSSPICEICGKDMYLKEIFQPEPDDGDDWTLGYWWEWRNVEIKAGVRHECMAIFEFM